MTGLQLLGPRVVAEVFDLELAYASQVEAFTKLAEGRAWQPDKIGGGHADDQSTVFCYAARLDRESGPISKFGSVNPANLGTGLPTIHAAVVLLHPDTGVPVAVLDGTAITARRTAAASAVAVSALGRTGEHIAVLGAGQQGVAHIRALHAAFPHGKFHVWCPDVAQRNGVTDALADEGLPVAVAASARAAISGADIVIAATSATSPLFDANDLPASALVVSVGCFEEHRCEIGPDTLLRSRTVVVDHAPTALAHCGPVVETARQGRNLGVVELGAILTGQVRVPTSGLTSYLSVGLGVQDAAAAWAIYRRAADLGLGITVDW